MTFSSRSPADSDFATYIGLNLPNGLVFTPVYHGNLTPADLTLTILPPATATPVFSDLSSPTIVYGATQTTLSGHLNGVGTLVPSGSVSITLDGVTEAAAIDSSTGNFSTSFSTAMLGASSTPYTITYAYAGDAHFNAATDGTGTLTVNQRPITITANDKSKTYGDANPALDATVTGTVNGDVLSYTLATGAGQFSNVGSYADHGEPGLQPQLQRHPDQRHAHHRAEGRHGHRQCQEQDLRRRQPGAGRDGHRHRQRRRAQLHPGHDGARQFSNVGGYAITVSLGANPNYSVTPTDGMLDHRAEAGHGHGQRQEQDLRRRQPGAGRDGHRHRQRRRAQLHPGHQRRTVQQRGRLRDHGDAWAPTPTTASARPTARSPSGRSAGHGHGQ